MIAPQCWPSSSELTSFWKLVWLSNSLRWHFWDIDWHLFVVVEVMDCRCQAGQVWWRTHTPSSKTMQWPRRPSLWINVPQLRTRSRLTVLCDFLNSFQCYCTSLFTSQYVVTEAIFLNINFFLLLHNICSSRKCHSISFRHFIRTWIHFLLLLLMFASLMLFHALRTFFFALLFIHFNPMTCWTEGEKITHKTLIHCLHSFRCLHNWIRAVYKNETGKISIINAALDKHLSLILIIQ